MPAALPPLPTAVVGSHPQPDWLIDRARLGQEVPRVRRDDLWRVPPELRSEAVRDAATLAIGEIESTGIDVVTDGEVDRVSYSSHMLTGLDGIDIDEPATILNRAGRSVVVPRVIGPIRHLRSTGVDAVRHLVATTTRVPKVTIPGPFTLAQQCEDGWYGSGDRNHDREALATAFADAVNAEALALEAAGAQVIQLDEPWYRNDPEGAQRYGVRVLDRALAGLRCRTAVHLCFGYAAVVPGDKPSTYPFLGPLDDSTVDEVSIEAAQPRLDLGCLEEVSSKHILLGVVDLADPESNTEPVIVERIRAALRRVDPERLALGPDCGMKYLSRPDAHRCLTALVDATRAVRTELDPARG